MVSSIQKSCKRNLSSFTTTTKVHFCKVCDVHMFFAEEIIEAMSSIAKKVAKEIKIQWIFELNVWSIAY